MVTKNFMKKKNATSFAKKRRKMGLNSSVYKKKKGYSVSSTRK